MRRKLFYLLAIIFSTVPPLAAVLSYFPLWKSLGREYALCGFTLLLLLLSAVPLYNAVKRLFSSPSVCMLWLIFFLIFTTLSKIVDQMIVISFVGLIGNIIGSVLFRLSRGKPGDEKQH